MPRLQAVSESVGLDKLESANSRPWRLTMKLFFINSIKITGQLILLSVLFISQVQA